MGDEDIIVYGSDEQVELGQEDEAEIVKFRDERLRRVHTYAQRYLAGDRVYIHCARLKGPVVNNPWKKREEHNDHEKAPSGMREFKRRRLMDEKEDEVMATPTQGTRTRETETVEMNAPQKPGPRRKRAAPKKVHEEDEDEEEEEEEEGEELDTISVASGVQEEFNTITVAAIGRRKGKTTAAGKSNSRAAGRGTSKTKPKARTSTSRNSSKASTTAKAPNKTASVSKKRGGEPLQEEVVEATTVTVKSTRGRRDGRGGRGRISAKPKAPVTQHTDYKEDEGEVSCTSSIRGGKRKAPAPVNTAKRGDRVSRTVSGQTTSKAKKAPPETINQSDHATELATEQPPEATVAATITNLWEESFEIPAVDPSEARANEPITPVANLSLEEPTPPSIFYGPSSTSKNGVTSSANLANKFIAIRQGTYGPVAKQSNSKARTIPAAGTKSKRSAPAAAAKKKTGKRAADGAAAIPEEEGESSERQEGGDEDQGDWVPVSSGFKYKKGNGKKAAVLGAKGDMPVDDEKAGKEESINKGKGRAKEATAAQQPKRKKPRVIDFAALSPFGGGQVVTKGRVYSSPRGDLGDEGKGADIPRADRNNIVGRFQTGNNVSVALMAPLLLNTPSGKPTSSGKGYSSLQEIPGNTNSQGNINKSPVAVNQKAAVVKEPTQLAPTVGQPSEVRGSAILSKEVDQAAQAAKCTTSTAIHSEVLPVPALGTPGEEPQPTEESFQQVEELAFAVPPPPVARLEPQSPWMNTQRQLSAARKGFMSLLDTPIAEETTPAKMPSATLSRLRRGPDFGLQKGAGTIETPSGNPLFTMPPESIVLMPGIPVPILAGLNPDPAVEGEACSGAGVVLDTSPSGPTTSRHRGESTATPATLSAFRTRNGADVTFSSPMAVRGDITGGSHSEGETQRDSIKSMPPPEFSPFKTFDTPTKSQFGSFMQGFSPLRYSPDGELGTIEEPPSQSTSQHGSQSQSSMVPIRLFGGDKPKDSRGPADKSENHQRVNPSAWLGLSQSRTSNISLFDFLAGTPAQRPAPPSLPALPSSPPPHSPQSRTPPPVLTKPRTSPRHSQLPQDQFHPICAEWAAKPGDEVSG